MTGCCTRSECFTRPGRHIIRIGPDALSGELVLPAQGRGLVLFAHGSGSSRCSPRNRHVASRLNEAGMATLLFDLLSSQEEGDRHNVFDVMLLSRRLMVAHSWVERRLPGEPIGYFGASTGAAAALVAAGRNADRVAAVVSRGGRPDLVDEELAMVTAPTLLIVGGEDEDVLDFNRVAFERLQCRKHLAVIPGASHLFEEPGALDVVCDLATAWMRQSFAEEG